MEIIRCGVHAFDEVLGIDRDEIRFFWLLDSNVEKAHQSAYRVTLFLSPHVINDSDLLWDTGKVESNEQRNIICKPKDGFLSATFHYWQVTVWDQDGEATMSDPNEFFTAYPRSNRLLPPYSMNQIYMPHSSLIFRTWFEDEPNRWKAVWIGNGSDKPLYIRKSFTLVEKPTRAIAFASGLGHFNLSCNGTPASAHVLDPGWTNYHRRVQFVAYDLSNKLTDGENVLGAHVGNGFYAGDQGDRFFWPTYEDNTYVRYGNELCFFLELHLFYPDGRRETLISGPDWKVRASATSLANIYASETHDRREYPVGWDATSFDDAAWAQAKPLTGPRGKLSYQSQPPVTLHETIHPVSTKTLAPGIVSFDLGQNMSTMVRIEVSGPAGAEVTVRYSESVDEHGAVFMPDPLFKEFEYGVYSKITLSGVGVESWEPDFSFTSARYIQVEGVAVEPDQGLPMIHSIVGRHVSSAARRLGSLTTDKDDVNALINMCYWSFVSNLFSYHTDCPQIEKFGWLEVTHLLAPATQYIRDMESLYTKILDDIADAQEADGLVPTMAPEMRYMCGPLHDTISWGCAIAFLPELIQRYYGSTYTFERIYGPCTRYLDYLRTKERKGGLIEHGLGDWGRDIAFGNLQANIETAIYHQCLRNVAHMAAALDRPADEAEYLAHAARIRAVYNTHLLLPEGTSSHPHAFYTTLDTPNTPTLTAVAQAIALQFHLAPAALIPQIQHSLLTSCSDNRLRAGEIGLKYLFNTLTDLRRHDMVLAMARQEEHPSYMRFLRRGETTLPEFWQDECRSKCHDMLGSVYEWCYEGVLGVRVLDAGYRRWSVRPPAGSEFGEVRGTVECPYGRIEVRWEAKGSGGRLRVRVPVGTVGVVLLPGEGTVVKVLREGWKEARRMVGRSFELEHGTYEAEILVGDGQSL
ncbi:bacterial alpha-L-rhamnosidase-domain-containing protein [Staphylotrichum tortipilum]|uniref:alpha-L-rhamnosidase n=1 Tax=Staphylotrichum tortipilum TaxID=2831512 RepID=A0AAN6MBA8_9PEZI|nr:bacterial alpha-L-rhamnosidase-domain-containing protein [Staphylotrichum longicolle]